MYLFGIKQVNGPKEGPNGLSIHPGCYPQLSSLHDKSFEIATIGIFSSASFSFYNAVSSLIQRPFSPYIFDNNVNVSRKYFFIIFILIVFFGFFHFLFSLFYGDKLILFFSNQKYLVYSDYLLFYSVSAFALSLKNLFQIEGIKKSFYDKYVKHALF